MAQSTMAVSPELGKRLEEGFTDEAGNLTPPLTKTQKEEVRRYGNRALWMGALIAGGLALGGIAVVKVGQALLGSKDNEDEDEEESQNGRNRNGKRNGKRR